MTMQYVQPTDAQIAQMQIFRDKYDQLFNEIVALPPSRGVSLALTNLEQSGMWLNKALTDNDSITPPADTDGDTDTASESVAEDTTDVPSTDTATPAATASDPAPTSPSANLSQPAA